MNDTYLTLSKISEGLYKEKGSKFIAYAFPVKDENEVREHLDELKKQYHDARHHCYAYILGEEGEVFRANDDGEPNHSAGDPILGQIKSRQLTYTLVIVVRYFGGTKLGVSGLINAYKVATAQALDENQIIEKLITSEISIKFEYPAMNTAMRLVKEYELEIAEQVLELNCRLKLRVRKGLAGELREKINSIPALRIID